MNHPHQPKHPRTCEQCGVAFLAKYASRRYCSDRCGARRKYANRTRVRPTWEERQSVAGSGHAYSPRHELACEICGRQFLSKYATKRFCSRWCQANRVPPPEMFTRVTFRLCEICGDTFTARLGSAARFCSRPDCLDHLAAKRREEARLRSRRFVKRPPDLKPGAKSEVIERAKVADRDQWTCGICTQPIDPDLADVNGHPLRLSIDHVVPIADYGDHTYANVRATHWFCNVSRGRRPPDLVLDLRCTGRDCDQMLPCDAHPRYADRRPSRHARGYDSSYERARSAALENATTCWKCQQPFSDDNPATGGHVVDIGDGGTVADGIRAECRRCNYGRLSATA